MVLMLKEYVHGCNTNQEGEIVFNLIKAPLQKGEHVVLSFKSITSVSSSFLNSSFIELLSFMSFDDIKKQLSFIDTNRHINESILRRFKLEFEEKQYS